MCFGSVTFFQKRSLKAEKTSVFLLRVLLICVCVCVRAKASPLERFYNSERHTARDMF